MCVHMHLCMYHIVHVEAKGWYYILMCVHMYQCMYHIMHVEVKGWLKESPLILHLGFWGSLLVKVELPDFASES